MKEPEADPKPLSEAEIRSIRAASRQGRGWAGGSAEWNAQWLATLDAERASRPETTGYIPGMQYGTGGTRQTWEHYAAARHEPGACPRCGDICSHDHDVSRPEPEDEPSGLQSFIDGWNAALAALPASPAPKEPTDG